MYSLLRTRCSVNQLVATWRLIAHAAKDGVKFLYGMYGSCGGGDGGFSPGQCMIHITVTVSPDVQNITYSHLGASFTFTMPFRFSFADYADMINVYGFCDGNSVHAVAVYQKHFPNRTTRGISHLINTRAVYFMHQR